MKFSIRDLLWLMLVVAIIAGLYWRQQHPPPKPPKAEGRTVEIYIDP